MTSLVSSTLSASIPIASLMESIRKYNIRISGYPSLLYNYYFRKITKHQSMEKCVPVNEDLGRVLYFVVKVKKNKKKKG